MAKQWQIRRGTTAQNEEFIGALAEVTYDTEKKTVRVHDGVTAGGTTITTNNDIQTLLNSIYNVGSIYIGTQSVCPMIALIPDSTWELVAADRSLQGSSSSHAANTTVAAGLPNITSGESAVIAWENDQTTWTNTGSIKQLGEDRFGSLKEGTGQWINSAAAEFKASYENPIYGNSDTVQPPAYVVNVWRRTT